MERKKTRKISSFLCLDQRKIEREKNDGRPMENLTDLIRNIFLPELGGKTGKLVSHETHGCSCLLVNNASGQWSHGRPLTLISLIASKIQTLRCGQRQGLPILEEERERRGEEREKAGVVFFHLQLHCSM